VGERGEVTALGVRKIRVFIMKKSKEKQKTRKEEKGIRNEASGAYIREKGRKTPRVAKSTQGKTKT